MNRILLLSIMLSFLGARLLGQNLNSALYPVQQHSDTLKFTVEGAATGLQLRVDGRVPTGIVDLDIPRLEDADVVIGCTPRLKEADFSYRLSISLYYPAAGRTLAQQTIQMGGQYSDAPFEIRFPDMTELGLYLNEAYELHIERQLLGTIDCTAERPTYTLEKQILPLATTFVGLSSVALGELVFGKQQRDRYEEYQNRWSRGDTDGAGLLQQAENARDTRKILTIGGGVVALAGAGWWYLRRRKVVKNQRIYDTYCLPLSESIGFEPAFINNGSDSALGVRLAIKLR